MSYWQFARVKAADREITVQLSLQNSLFQSLKTWNAASRATSTAMNNVVENDILLHSTVNIRDNGYKCVQYFLKERISMPGPPACTILVFEHKFIPELLVFAPTRSLHTEVHILNPRVDVDDTVGVKCKVIAFEASFEFDVDTNKSPRFLRDLVLHHLRVAPLCFSQPELGTNVVIDIFHPNGSQILSRCDERTLKAMLYAAVPRGMVDGHAVQADPDSPWEFVG